MCECIAEVMLNVSQPEEVMMNVRSELSPGGQRVLDYMCITPADSSQMSISAGRCGDGLEGRQSIHSVLLMMRMPVIRSILQNTSSDFCPPDSVIIVDSDWKDRVTRG